jgi:hypothetical protein
VSNVSPPANWYRAFPFRKTSPFGRTRPPIICSSVSRMLWPLDHNNCKPLDTLFLQPFFYCVKYKRSTKRSKSGTCIQPWRQSILT